MESIQENVQPGLVISYFGNSVAVEATNGQVFQCHLKRNQMLPVVGDRVQFYLEKGETGVIQSIEPRQSELARGDNRGKMKTIAANVDMMLIVMAPKPIFSEYLIDRYLIAAELLHIQPVIVLNKIDLLNDVEIKNVHEELQMYEAIYPVIYSSAITHIGLEKLQAELKQHTAVLVGPSGVGKSSIIAALSDDESIRVGDVSKKGAGKHTTTATRLYHLPQGGDLIDSPGVREFSLWPIEQSDILRGFREFQTFLNQCKFRDCAHLVEPGCAVQAAVLDGKISAKRFESYRILVNDANKTKKY